MNQSPPRRAAAICLLLAAAAVLPGCDRKGGACDPGGNTREVVITNYVTRLTPEALNQLIAEAVNATLLGEPVDVMPPLPDAEVAATNRAAAVRLQMSETTRELNRYRQLRNEYERQLRNDEPEFKVLWDTIQSTQKDYDTLLADHLSGTLVPGRIAQLTQRLQALFKQLEIIEETP